MMNEIRAWAMVHLRNPRRYREIERLLWNIESRGIPGSLAECGVYRGVTARFIRRAACTWRKLYLYDTFSGFGLTDPADSRFRSTSLEAVKRYVGEDGTIIYREGLFPFSIREERLQIFAFVLLDLNKFTATYDALEFFWPRINPGGYLMVHDYDNPAEPGVRRACDIYFQKVFGWAPPPLLVRDRWGSAIYENMIFP